MQATPTIIDRAGTLLTRCAAYPPGEISPSVYETARIASLAPWVAQQEGRLRFLLASQQQDGSWCHIDDYALIPTLSALEALLQCLRRGETGLAPSGALIEASRRGLQALARMLDPTSPVPVADTIAAELIIPSLVEDIHAHSHELRVDPIPGLESWADVRFALPAAADFPLLLRIRSNGAQLPAKLHHTLEALKPRAHGNASGIKLVNGNIGCSPAATAAWIDGTASVGENASATAYLHGLASRHGGPVPGVSPITTFEYAWSVWALARAGVDVHVPAAIADYLRCAITDEGSAVAEGLLCDADTTAVVVCCLGHLGIEVPVDCLYRFDRGSHFVCWTGERNPSVSANAHVLEALTQHAARHPQMALAEPSALARIAQWLLAHQNADGFWLDKWHASPYYATHCCVAALVRGGGAVGVERARRWVLETQREGGGWGWWRATREESAYAVQTLLGGDRRPSSEILDAVGRGEEFLHVTRGTDDPPLWHDKDLYAPVNVIEAEVLAASHLIASYLGKHRIARESQVDA